MITSFLFMFTFGFSPSTYKHKKIKREFSTIKYEKTLIYNNKYDLKNMYSWTIINIYLVFLNQSFIFSYPTYRFEREKTLTPIFISLLIVDIKYVTIHFLIGKNNYLLFIVLDLMLLKGKSRVVNSK